MALQRKYLPCELKDGSDRQKVIIAVVHLGEFFRERIPLYTGVACRGG